MKIKQAASILRQPVLPLCVKNASCIFTMLLFKMFSTRQSPTDSGSLITEVRLKEKTISHTISDAGTCQQSCCCQGDTHSKMSSHNLVYNKMIIVGG